MKAAVLRDFMTPLAVQDVSIPKPTESEVLIKVEVCGVCHSDLHVADGDWSQLAGIVKKPLILGHEVVGTIVEVGSAVQGVKIGDRVGVPWIHWTCGKCEFCREGNENLCIRQQITGVTVDGGYAEFVKAPATHVASIPDNLASEQAAPLLCAGVTVHRALKQSRITTGQRLAVFGVGGLGHLAVQIGCELGADVTAIDISEEKLALAKSLGASRTLNAASDKVVQQLRSQGGVHVALVTSAAKAAYDMAFYCVRPTGVLLAVGLPAQDICFPPILMAAGEIRIQWNKVMDTNLTGTFLFSQAVGKAMIRQEHGKIINMSSVAGLGGASSDLQAIGYHASKGGVIAFTKDLACKWAAHNIQVNAIAPGWFPTHMSSWILEHRKESLLAKIPLHRFGGDHDLKGAAIFLASDASAYVTGHVLVVDGGQTAW